MRLPPSALPLAFVVALAVGGIVFVAGVREGGAIEVVRVWTWVDAPGDVGEVIAALESRAFRADVVRLLNGRQPTGAEGADVIGWLHVAAQGSDVEVRVEGATEAEAVTRERAIASALVAWDDERATEAWQAEVVLSQDRVDALTERIRAAQVLGDEAADRDVDALIEERDAALVRRERAARALAIDVAGRLAPLPAITRALAETPWRSAGLAAGLAFGIALLAALRPSAPTSSRDRERIRDRAAGGLPAPADVLAVFPNAGEEDVIGLRSAAETLAQVLAAHLAQVRTAVVMVTSLHHGEGKSTVAAHLAEAFARSGKRALLVDGSLRGPALADRYAVGAPSGGQDGDAPRIASTFEWMRRPDGRYHVVGVDVGSGHRLDVVPQYEPVRPEPGAAETFFEPFGEALGRWRGYEVVVVDAAPLAPVADARHLLPFATGVVVVVDRHRDGRRRRAEAAKLVRAAGARVLGFVIDEPRGPATVSAPAAGP